MSVFTQPKCKRCRAAGVKLFLKGEKCYTPKCPVVRRKYGPGIHGFKSSRSRLTAYGKQLKEKQRVKAIYGLRERQLLRYYDKARTMSGDVGHNFLMLLEKRLDNVVYRLGISKSRGEARQTVNHGHILLNNKKVNIPSILVRPGDEVGIRSGSIAKSLFLNLESKLSGASLPSWLGWESIDSKRDIKAKILKNPPLEELPEEVDARSIIEYYSK